MSRVFLPRGHSPLRPDWLAGVGGLELRNVDANYLFERSHRFAGIQPNSGFGDYSRLSCGVGDTQLGRRPGSRQGCLRATPAELARISGTVNQVVPLAEVNP